MPWPSSRRRTTRTANCRCWGPGWCGCRRAADAIVNGRACGVSRAVPYEVPLDATREDGNDDATQCSAGRCGRGGGGGRAVPPARKRVVWGKGGAVRIDRGGRRNIKTEKHGE